MKLLRSSGEPRYQKTAQLWRAAVPVDHEKMSSEFDRGEQRYEKMLKFVFAVTDSGVAL